MSAEFGPEQKGKPVGFDIGFQEEIICPSPLKCSVSENKLVVQIPEFSNPDTSNSFAVKSFCVKSLPYSYLDKCIETMTNYRDPKNNALNIYWRDGLERIGGDYVNSFELGGCYEPQGEKTCILMKDATTGEEYFRIPAQTFLNEIGSSTIQSYKSAEVTQRIVLDGAKFMLPWITSMLVLFTFGERIFGGINRYFKKKERQKKLEKAESIDRQAVALHNEAEKLRK